MLNSSCIPQGHKLLVETQDGTKFQGVFHTLSKTTDDNFDVILKMARKLVSSICSDVFFSFCSRAWLQDAEEQVIRDESQLNVNSTTRRDVECELLNVIC